MAVNEKVHRDLMDLIQETCPSWFLEYEHFVQDRYECSEMYYWRALDDTHPRIHVTLSRDWCLLIKFDCDVFLEFFEDLKDVCPCQHKHAIKSLLLKANRIVGFNPQKSSKKISHA